MSIKAAQEVIQTSEVTSPMLFCLIFSGKLLKEQRKMDVEIKHNLLTTINNSHLIHSRSCSAYWKDFSLPLIITLPSKLVNINDYK